uniref:hypothetical protein n=1 Tax=Cupriavidus yeoncheonensis TaxID=1462994 RepID=UPI003F4982EF
MDPDDVIRDFERLALDDTTELEVDDAIAGLAVLYLGPATLMTRQWTNNLGWTVAILRSHSSLRRLWETAPNRGLTMR